MKASATQEVDRHVGTRRRSRRAMISIATLAATLVAAIPLLSGTEAEAANGDFVTSVTFDQSCGALGTGIAFDGENLWFSCYAHTPDLFRADPNTGHVTASFTVAGGLGSIAYDSTRNALWAGPSDMSGQVRLISLDASKSVTSTVVQFTSPYASGSYGLDDGIAYDGIDDTLLISPDVSSSIYRFASDGTLLGSFPWAGSGCYNSGLAIGGDLLYEGADGCNHVWVVPKTATSTVSFDFSTTVLSDPNFRDEGLACDPVTFAAEGKEVMWSKEAYEPMRAHAYEIPSGSCGVGGLPPIPTTSASRATVASGRVEDVGSSGTGPVGLSVVDTGDVLSDGAGTGDAKGARVNGNPLSGTALYAHADASSGPSAVSHAVAGLTTGRYDDGATTVDFSGVRSTAQSTCSASSGDVEIGSISVNGTPVDLPEAIPPNTTIPLGAGSLTLNEQGPVPAADQGLRVVAIHLEIPGVADVSIGIARSEVHECA